MRDLTRLRRRHLPLRLRRRERSVGQSLVELALIAPVLLILLMGSLQVAYLGYGAVTVDTAAREAGRIASINLSALHSIAQNGNSYTCAADPSTDSNPICKAVSNNAGLLSGHTFSLVRIDLNVTVAQNDEVPGDVQQVACGGTALSGTVSGIPSGVAQISDTLNGTNATSSDGSGNYTDCLNPSPSNGQTQTITISATAGTNGQCTGSTQAVLTKSGSSWDADKSSYPITLTCPTPTPAPTATPTPTATPSATATPTPTPTATPVSGLPPVGNGPSAASCSTQTPAAGSFVTVTVQYHAGIFVPFLGALLADSGASYKTLRAVVTVRVNPCTA